MRTRVTHVTSIVTSVHASSCTIIRAVNHNLMVARKVIDVRTL